MKLGLNGVLYYLPTGDRATWGEPDEDGVHEGAAPGALAVVRRVRDLAVDIDKGEADMSTRDNDGWAADVGTLKRAALTFDMVWDPTKASHKALLGAFLMNDVIACAALDSAKDAGAAEGFWADFHVFGFGKQEELEDGQKLSLTLKPTLSDIPPEWVRVTGS